MSENQGYKDLQNGSSVMITGGSGLIGKYLTSTLMAEGYNVSHLSRRTNQFGKVRVFRWDPEREIIDPAIFEGVDYLIHLAGANMGEKRWTKKRKEDILNSRVESAEFLFRIISVNRIRLKAFICASAVGYYGSDTSDTIFEEKDPPSTDFLGSICRRWEDAAGLFRDIGIRTVMIRSAVVLEKSDSALSRILKPSKYGFLIQTGNGEQHMPWIHISDLCNIYFKAVEDSEMNGAFNAASPQHVTHKVFINTLGGVIKKPVFPFPAPAFLIRLALGEMSDMILKGSRVSSEKIIQTGYHFQYSNLDDALKNLLYT